MWVTAFTLGLAGSLHCIGMCSPLVMAVTTSRQPFWGNKLLYNLGRIFTYAILGGLVGIIGSVLDISGLQKILSELLGGSLIIFGVTGMSAIRIPFLTKTIFPFSLFIKKYFAKFLAAKSKSAIVVLGMLNGLLPCGLTYIALAYCVTLTPIDGFLYMLTFGVATFPVMLGLTTILMKGLNIFNLSLKNLTTVSMIALGVLLVVRSYFSLDHDQGSVQQDNITICK